MMRRTTIGILSAASIALAACSSDAPSRDRDKPRGAVTAALQWKRHAAFEGDLSAALALAPEALCQEFGQGSCIRDVHVSPLGGHDPFKSGLLESSAEPLATTPTVVDRIVLSACVRRAELDRDAGADAVVFRGLDLQGDAPAGEASEAVVRNLYRRFLARDPEAEELAQIALLARDEGGAPVPALSFVEAACFAVGTSSEFLFF